MKQVIYCFLGFLSFSACKVNAPEKTQSKIEETVEENFPKSWVGSWEGRLQIFSPEKGKRQDIFMGLEIYPLDSVGYTWSIIYGEGEQRQVRAYELYAKDAEKGHYFTDEKNSILLDDFYTNNTLYSRFDVGGTFILAIYRKTGSQITFEIVAGSNEPIRVSGDTTDIPKVNSYGISAAQTAVLTRIKK